MKSDKKEKKIKRLVGLFDSHYPHTIDMGPILKYLASNPPDIFVLGGDNMSLDVISHWHDENFKNIGFNAVRENLHKEAAGFTAQLQDLRKAMPKTKFVYILGNHEDWLKQFCVKYPQMNDLSIESLLPIHALDIEVVPFGKYYKVGKLYLAHGHQFGTDNPAKQAVVRCHKSVAFGHHHGHIEWSDFSDIDSKHKHIGILVPCYASLAPGYGHGRPNRWINGFLNVAFEPSGYFYANIQHVAVDGRFVTPDGTQWN